MEGSRLVAGSRFTSGAGRPARVVTLLKALGVAASGLAIVLLAEIIALLAVTRLGVEFGPITLLLFMLFLVQGVGFTGIALWNMRSRRSGVGWPRLQWPSRHDRRWVLRGYLYAMAGAMTGGIVLAVIGVEPAVNEVTGLAQQDTSVFLVLVPLAFLVIGPAEELLFRGVVQRKLRQAYGPIASVVVASFIFAAAHFVALSGGGLAGMAASVAILFLPSLALGASYERTGNLIVPILVHGAYNASLFLGLYLALEAA
jgi:hypothetical protein